MARLAIPAEHFLACGAYLRNVAQLLDFAHARKLSEWQGKTLADSRAADQRAVQIKRYEAHAVRIGRHSKEGYRIGRGDR